MFNYNRYKLYTSRDQVYLFTLRDYSEMMVNLFGGCIIQRDDMPIQGAYLMALTNTETIKSFIQGESDVSFSDNGSLIQGRKTFVKKPFSMNFTGDGTAKVFNAVPNMASEGIQVSVDGTAKEVTVNENKTTASFTGGSIDLASGIVTMGSALAEDAVLTVTGSQVLFYLNYMYYPGYCIIGLNALEEPALVSVSDVVLPADGTKKEFEIGACKSGSVSLKINGGAAVTDNGQGQFTQTVEEETTILGTVDYMTGKIVLETAPNTLTYSASAYKFN